MRSLLLSGLWLMLAMLTGLVLTLAGIFLYLNPQTPAAETYRHVNLEIPLRIYTAEGALLAEFGERRAIPIAIEDVPLAFQQALLDTEDKRFYEHGGIDYLSLANDTLALLWSQDVSSGGASTITMQLARNISFSLEQTFIRKFKEMLLALKLENELTKDEILELYINAVPFGKRAYGAQAAAYTYYNQPLGELKLEQLAMLAGIPQAPSAGNPINGPQRALRRRNLVLSRMLDQGSISQAQFAEAAAAPISARIYGRQLETAAPFAAEWVRAQLLPRYPDLYTAGYAVFTTIQTDAQHAATRALREGLMAYDRTHGYRGPEAELAEKDYLDTLERTPHYADLYPAVVTDVTANDIGVLLADGSSARVDFSTMTWARRYLNVNQRGPVPRQPAAVTKAGDLIRLRQLPETPSQQDAAAQNAEGASSPSTPEQQPAYRWHFAQLPEAQGALVSLNPDNGAVYALEGGFDFSLNQFNHALQAQRQPGSGFKPFVYSAALARDVTPASIFMDAPLVFDDAELETEYRPDNDNSRYNGPTRLRVALYRSINLVSMRVLLDIGAGNVLRHAKKFAFPTERFPRDTQLALGGGTMAVTPLQMAQAYGVLANGGFEVEPYIIERIVDLRGNVVEEVDPLVVCDDGLTAPEQRRSAMPEDSTAAVTAATDLWASADANAENSLAAISLAPDENALALPVAEPEPRCADRVLDARNAYLMDSMLRDVVRRGTGRRALAIQRSDLAGKTGTTNDGTDTWFNGYGGNLVTTVWVGFSDYEPLGARAYGGNTALPIWVDYMRSALENKPLRETTQPSGIAVVKIDPETGEAAHPGQSNAIFEYFLAENAPEPPPSYRSGSEPTEEVDFRAVDIF